MAARTRKRLSVQLWTTTSLVPLPGLNSSRSPTPSSSSPRRSERCTRSAVGASVAHGTPLEKTVGVIVGVGAGIGVSVTTGSAGGTGVGVSVTAGSAAGGAVGVSVAAAGSAGGTGVGVSVITAGSAGGAGVGVSVGLGTVWALPLVVAPITLRPTISAAQAALRLQRTAIINHRADASRVPRADAEQGMPSPALLLHPFQRHE